MRKRVKELEEVDLRLNLSCERLPQGSLISLWEISRLRLSLKLRGVRFLIFQASQDYQRLKR